MVCQTVKSIEDILRLALRITSEDERRNVRPGVKVSYFFRGENQNYQDREHDVYPSAGFKPGIYWKFVEETSYTRMGGWWDRKGENEIDLVCDDEFAKKIVIYEIKIDPKRIDLKALKAKAEAFFAKNPELKDRKVTFRALSVRDM